MDMKKFGSFIRTLRKEKEIIDRVKKRLSESDTYQNHETHREWLTVLENRCMTKQIPEAEFAKLVRQIHREEMEKLGEIDEEELDAEVARALRQRKMECICVREHIEYDEQGREKPHVLRVLCDDERSIMQDCYDKTLLILRSYKYPQQQK